MKPKFLQVQNFFALFLNFARPPLNEPGRERDWVETGSDVIQSTQTQINMVTSVLEVQLMKRKD